MSIHELAKRMIFLAAAWAAVAAIAAQLPEPPPMPQRSIAPSTNELRGTRMTLVMEKGKPCLRAENPRYPKLFPARELLTQGVMVALIRKCK